MSHILFLSYFFTPDSLSTAVLMAQLAQDLQAKNHKITVITTTPHYNLEDEALRQQPLHNQWGRWVQESQLDGIQVYHIQVAPKGSRFWLRALDYVRYHLLGTLVGCFLVKKPDILFVPSPPLTIGLHAWLLQLWHRVPFIYNVQEIYPDVMVKLGVLQNRPLIWLLERIESFIYNRAVKVSVISEWFRRVLADKGVPASKMIVIPNFVDTHFMNVADEPSQEHLPTHLPQVIHPLADKFTVLYAGNLGLTQDFETLLAAAAQLTHLPMLHFLIIGGGARQAWLAQQITERNLSNVTLLDYQPREQVPYIYASSDLCVVPMKAGMALDTFPSKIYTIMAASKAVLVSTDADSELAWVVGQADCGWVVDCDDVDAFVRAVTEAYADPPETTRRGTCGRAYVIAHHSREAVSAQYDRLISDIDNRQ